MSEQSLGLQAPPADDVTGPWWDATKQRRLLVQRCDECGATQFPPRAVCTSCSRMDSLGWLEASGDAIIDSWTLVHRAARADAVVPYVIARVELAEGPILLTRLLGAEECRCGDPVHLDWIPLEDGRALPAFRPVAT